MTRDVGGREPSEERDGEAPIGAARPVAANDLGAGAGDGFGGHRAGIWPLVSAAEMQALDRATITGRGIPGEILMESAGRALLAPALALRAQSARPQAPIVALCGAGNNGGDGFVVVRHLLAEGVPAQAWLLGDPARLPADAAANWRRLAPAARRIMAIEPSGSSAESASAEPAWDALFGGVSVVVDALFGTGLGRAIEGGIARAISALETARGAGLKVLAVDLPSGIHADTGQILGVAVRADATVTISLPKPGLALEPGRSRAGAIEVARVGIDDPDPTRRPRVELWNARAIRTALPVRPRDGHKGRFGHVLLAAGSSGKWGAASLASRAALRAGAGLVTLVLPAVAGRVVPGLCAEVMTEDAPATAAGGFAREAAKIVVELAQARSALALGPGLGTDPATVACVRAVLAGVERPLVLDADGLNACVGALDGLRLRRAATVLTPHPGEAARLLESDAARVNADRIGAARRLADQTGAVVLLKGAGSVVAEPGGRAVVVPTGGPLLATGGTGDVLTGIVAARLAAGQDAFEAAVVAAYWHGATADADPRAEAGFGMLASELADGLPECAAALARDFEREGRALHGDREDGSDGAAGRDGLQLRFPGP